MLKEISLENVGPSPSLRIPFGSRLNVITGDNGLGKSFLLDVAWWALTRKWPAEVNSSLTAGRRALPTLNGTPAQICFKFTGVSQEEQQCSAYDARQQAWPLRPGRPANPGLVLYAMSDGSFAVWDPKRNYWRSTQGSSEQERIPAYVFNPAQVWDGYEVGSSTLCNGLIRDWATWQRENGPAFDRLKRILAHLSPSGSERIEPGGLRRISLDDVRDMPTLRMPYGQDVAVVHASSGMRRILALAYLLSWAWDEHLQAASLLGENPASQVIFLVDELESHLHPRWQRSILPTLMGVMEELSEQAQVQLILSTHSPLVMASVEPSFNSETDKWLDLDYVNASEPTAVTLTEREFERQGDAVNWLTSEAFDLSSAVSLEAEKAMDKASAIMQNADSTQEDALAAHAELQRVLGGMDPFWLRWRFLAGQRGWEL